MLELSADATAAETEVRAILFVLVAFAHIDGSVHAAEREYIQDALDKVVERRALESFPNDPEARANVLPAGKRTSTTPPTASSRTSGPTSRRAWRSARRPTPSCTRG